MYADGRSPSDTYDSQETMELAIIDSDFADNLIAVGALDSSGQIAVYSTIAGPDYDGSSYAFLVDDGTAFIDLNSITTMTGDVSVNEGNSVYNGTFNGTLTETFYFRPLRNIDCRASYHGKGRHRVTKISKPECRTAGEPGQIHGD